MTTLRTATKENKINLFAINPTSRQQSTNNSELFNYLLKAQQTWTWAWSLTNWWLSNFSQWNQQAPQNNMNLWWIFWIPKANASNDQWQDISFLDDLMVDISKGKTKEQIMQYYPELNNNTSLINDLIIDIWKWATKEQIMQYYPELSVWNSWVQQKENISWLDIWVKTWRAISNFWEKMKFKAWNDWFNSDSILKSNIWALWEVGKFLLNLPWDAVQFVGDMVGLISAPIWTVKSIKLLWEAIIEWWLNKLTWQDVWTSEEVKLANQEIVKGLKELSDDPSKIRDMMIENPFDVLTTITWWVSTAKNIAKAKWMTWLVSKLEKVEQATNPINILKTEYAIAKQPIKWTWKTLGNAGAQLLWKTTWTSGQTIKTAFAQWWTQEFQQALKWATTTDDILNNVKGALDDIKSNRNKLYWESNKILQANTNKLDISDIKTTLANTLDDYKVKVWDNGKLDFWKSTITQGKSQIEIQAMFDDIMKWDDTTPGWLDILKQRIQDRWAWVTDSWKSDRLSTMLSNEVKNKIVWEVKEYAEMTKDFEKVSNDLREINTILSTWGNKQTAITKLNSVLRDNFTARQDMIKLIEQYTWKNLQAQIAWTSLNPMLAKWLAWVITWWWVMFWQLANPVFWTWLATASPRLIWEIAKTVWVTRNKMNSFINTIKTNNPNLPKKLLPSAKVTETAKKKLKPWKTWNLTNKVAEKIDEIAEKMWVKVNFFDYKNSKNIDNISNKSLKANNLKFNEELKRLIKWELPKNHVFDFWKPSGKLKTAWIKDVSIKMFANKLKDKSTQEWHQFNLNSLKDFQSHLQNPIAIFESETIPWSKVILTELKEWWKNFVWIIRLQSTKKWLEINSIRSVYPRDFSQIKKALENKKNVYTDKEKLLHYFSEN